MDIRSVEDISKAAGLLNRRTMLVARRQAVAAGGTRIMELVEIARHLGRLSEIENLLREALLPMVDEQITAAEGGLSEMGITNPAVVPAQPVEPLPAPVDALNAGATKAFLSGQGNIATSDKKQAAPGRPV